MVLRAHRSGSARLLAFSKGFFENRHDNKAMLQETEADGLVLAITVCPLLMMLAGETLSQYAAFIQESHAWLRI